MTDTAMVETLTAEVRALMVGKRQVTLSVYRQLDSVAPDHIEPFGRVRDSQDHPGARETYVIGRDIDSGSLVRSAIGWRSPEGERRNARMQESKEVADEVYALVVERNAIKVVWDQLPLIVLAGLR